MQEKKFLHFTFKTTRNEARRSWDKWKDNNKSEFEEIGGRECGMV